MEDRLDQYGPGRALRNRSSRYVERLGVVVDLILELMVLVLAVVILVSQR